MSITTLTARRSGSSSATSGDDGVNYSTTVGAIFRSIWAGTTSAGATALCPDLLRYEQIGAADGTRGRIVRGFFWMLRAWPVK